jgi:hypothetical protein
MSWRSLLERRRQVRMLALQQLHVHVQPGQRRAQLVGGVGGEAALGLQRRIQARQHIVQGACTIGSSSRGWPSVGHLRQVVRGLGGDRGGGAAQRLQHAPVSHQHTSASSTRKPSTGSHRASASSSRISRRFFGLLADLHLEAARLVAHHEHPPAVRHRSRGRQSRGHRRSRQRRAARARRRCAGSPGRRPRSGIACRLCAPFSPREAAACASRPRSPPVGGGGHDHVARFFQRVVEHLVGFLPGDQGDDARLASHSTVLAATIAPAGAAAATRRARG